MSIRFPAGLLVATLLGGLLASTAIAQIPVIRPNPQALVDYDYFAADTIAVCKLSANPAAASFLLPKYQAETRTRVVTVERMVPEVRTRTVRTPFGARTEEYTVMVPVYEQREQTYAVLVPRDELRIDVPLAETVFIGLDGNRVAPQQLAGRLQNIRHVFLHEIYEGPGGQPEPVPQRLNFDPFYVSVFQESVMVVFVPEKYLRDRYPAMPQDDPFGGEGNSGAPFEDDPFGSDGSPGPLPPAPVPDGAPAPVPPAPFED